MRDFVECFKAVCQPSVLLKAAAGKVGKRLFYGLRTQTMPSTLVSRVQLFA
jgi:hypothetical protein